MKHGVFSRLVLSGAFLAMASTGAGAGSPDALGSARTSLSGYVGTSDGFFEWGSGQSLAAVTDNKIGKVKNIICPSSKGCVISVVVTAQIQSTADDNNAWGDYAEVDGQIMNPGSPFLSVANTTQYNGTSYIGIIQVKKGTHTIQPVVFVESAASLHSWSASWLVSR